MGRLGNEQEAKHKEVHQVAAMIAVQSNDNQKERKTASGWDPRTLEEKELAYVTCESDAKLVTRRDEFRPRRWSRRQ